MPSLVSLFFELLRRPRATIEGVASRGDPREGRAAILVLGLVHAAFSLTLFFAGHAPRFGIPGLGRENHYLVQALFIVPLYLALSALGGLVALRLAGAEGQGSRDASIAVFRVAYAAPMLFFFLVPDLVVYVALGFGAIGKAMRYYAPLAALACVALGALGFSRVHGLRASRAALAVLAGFAAQALVGGAFLR